MLVRTTIRTVWFLNVSGICPIGEAGALPGKAEEERQAVQPEQEPERWPKWRPSVHLS